MIEEGFKLEKPVAEVSLFTSLAEMIKQKKVQVLVLFILTLLVYFTSLQAPFYLDDYHSIVENPVIHDLSKLLENRNFQYMRLVGFFTLSANYEINQLSVFGYHLVNMVIHFLAGLSVFFLIVGLTQASVKIQTETLFKQYYLLYLPLLVAIIFIVHPLQTQAVTYIVQRFASLAALFYIATLASFVFARLTQQIHYFILVAIFAVLALLSKENAVTLFASLILIELLFFQQFTLKKALAWTAGAFLSVFVLGLCAYYIFGVSFESIDRFTHTGDTQHLSRIDYFSTQMLVIWHYIKLFFIPIGFHLDYDVKLQQSFFSLPVLLSFFAHIALIIGSLVWARKFPLVVFAVVFYYLSHSVESSVIPIFDLAFEHRTYLPNLGLSIITGLALLALFSFKLTKSFALYITLGIIILLSVLTIQRNNQWLDPIAFYTNEVKYSPNKERVWAELGKVYLKDKQATKALEAFSKALSLGKEGNTINALPTTFLNTYIALLYTKQLRKAVYFESIMPINGLTAHDKSIFYLMQANRMVNTKEYKKALLSYNKSLSFNPNNGQAKTNLEALKKNLNL